jgi:DNA-binding response OmpR family regulator
VNIVAEPALLIVEDEIFIAMDLEQCLGDLGYVNIVIASSCEQAGDWLASHTPAAAILDISLKDGSCTPLARMLVEREVPFIVSSGLPVSAAEPLFSKGYWIPKPFQPEGLKEALLSLKIYPVGRHFPSKHLRN